MAATVLISRLEETPEMEPVEYGKYDEGLQMSPENVMMLGHRTSSPTRGTTYYVKEGDVEQDEQPD